MRFTVCPFHLSHSHIFNLAPLQAHAWSSSGNRWDLVGQVSGAKDDGNDGITTSDNLAPPGWRYFEVELSNTKLVCKCGNFDIAFDHFSRILHPAHAVWRALRAAQSQRMLIGACNPIHFPIPAGVCARPSRHKIGDNPYRTAQNFLDQNELDQNFLDQISEFVHNNTNQAEEAAAKGAPPAAAAAAAPMPPSYFPQPSFVSIGAVKSDGALGLILHYSPRMSWLCTALHPPCDMLCVVPMRVGC